ncbi:hypothetical protein HK099_008435 [Clydaea vesicula]|uniref:Uncharacterized protein n=1 Tax=Clydaea vesicula TaxID=447962 RepID=A0AAD5XT57_9FUNG|nr:hypothetical protein HK099_008435 [Clydaea vesicula]
METQLFYLTAIFYFISCVITQSCSDCNGSFSCVLRISNINDYRNCICGNVGTAEICATNPSFNTDLHTCAMVSNSPTNILWGLQHSGSMSLSCSTGELSWHQQQRLPSWRDEPSSPSPPVNNPPVNNPPSNPPANNPPANNPPSNNNPPANNPPSNNNTPANNPPTNNNTPANNPPSNNNSPRNNPPANNNSPANNPPSNNNLPANNPPSNNNSPANNPPSNNSIKPAKTNSVTSTNQVNTSNNNSDSSDTSTGLANNPGQPTSTLAAQDGIVSNTPPSGNGPTIGLIFGIVFGVVAFFILIIFCIKRNNGKYSKSYNTPYENNATYQYSNNQNYNYGNNDYVNATNNPHYNNGLNHGNYDHSVNESQTYGNGGYVTPPTASYSNNSAPYSPATPQSPAMTYQNTYRNSSSSGIYSRNSVLSSIPNSVPPYSSHVPLNPDSDVKSSSGRINAFDMDDEALKRNSTFHN